MLLCFCGNTDQALAGCFARRDCPIWADSSTTRECHELEEALGGPKAVAEATGSAAYCRFSGNQVNFATFSFSYCRLAVPLVDTPAFAMCLAPRFSYTHERPRPFYGTPRLLTGHIL